MKNIKLSQGIIKNLSKKEYYNREDFTKDCNTYIKALKAGRVQYIVTHVSGSGMSRDILIQSFEGNMNKCYFRTYSLMLEVMGFNLVNKYSNDIKVKGCGMSMTFATNYSIIHSFFNMGFINKKDCDILAQKI